jgi:hypothetical protein
MPDPTFPTTIDAPETAVAAHDNKLWIAVGDVPDIDDDEIETFSDLNWQPGSQFAQFVPYGRGGQRVQVPVGRDDEARFRLYGDPRNAKIAEILGAAYSTVTADKLAYYVRHDPQKIQYSGAAYLAITDEGTDARGIHYWEIQLAFQSMELDFPTAP